MSSNKNNLTGSDHFTDSPLLSILPIEGRVKDLESLATALFARHEKVKNLIEATDKVDAAYLERLSSEEGMLSQVLEWLAIKPKDVEVPKG